MSKMKSLIKLSQGLNKLNLLYNDGRFDECRTVIDQILIVNPYHLEAVRLLKKTYAKLQEVGELRQEVTRLDRLGEAEWEWG